MKSLHILSIFGISLSVHPKTQQKWLSVSFGSRKFIDFTLRPGCDSILSIKIQAKFNTEKMLFLYLYAYIPPCTTP